jgi:hypothetical protein
MSLDLFKCDRPTRSEIRLLIIRNLQSEKTIVNEQEEFYLPEGKFPSEKE